jgi:hypothetical protein
MSVEDMAVPAARLRKSEPISKTSACQTGREKIYCLADVFRAVVHPDLAVQTPLQKIDQASDLAEAPS